MVYRYVSAAKGKSRVKRPRQLEDAEDGDKLEHLRSELDSLTSLLPLDESEEPDENLSAELDRLPSPRQLEDGDNLEHLRSELDSLTSRLPLKESEEPEENLSAELDRLPSPQHAQEPKELEEPEEAKDLKEAKAEHAEPKEAEEAETHAEPKATSFPGSLI